MIRFEKDLGFQDGIRRNLAYMQEVLHSEAYGGATPKDPKDRDWDPDEVVERAVRQPPFRATLLHACIDFEQCVDDVRRDLAYLSRRLIGKEEAVFMEDDRLRAEKNFRLGLVLPLAFLFLVLAIRIDPLWAMGLTSSLILFYLGVDIATAADVHTALDRVLVRPSTDTI